ncbi:hypothetical protein NP493_1201g01040 [Ridgeia piscesae]|uniref:Integrator complex subunit 2 n=1 Tax=Ridgeia piscesae TaxID=27915 RepID=A0AAD9NI66_RIDPI|nr:hypothetical protein NP493_1201g01040 [Ridgeia piscesae]
MSAEVPVTANAFEAIQNIDTGRLSALSERELRPILSCLVRMSLCSPLDTSDKWGERRKEILRCLAGIETVNSLVGLLSIDFHALEQDAKKEQQLRAKTGGQHPESLFISQLSQGIALEFEHSDAARKLRLLLSELLFVVHQIKEPQGEGYWKQSELFDSEVYLEELSDVLCIAQAELPSLLPITEVAEALLHLPNGAWLLCRLVANVPDAFHKVCCSLVANAPEKEEEGVAGQKRVDALRRLCNICPSHALTVRALCVEHCKLASLAVALTLARCDETGQATSDGDDTPEGSISDVVAFVSGVLLGSDMNVRKWFATFVKNGQKSKDTTLMLSSLRHELVRELKCMLDTGANEIAETRVVQGCAFIRLYCALKGIASLRFNDEESRLLLELATRHPPPTAAGVRFICLALSMLLACPYILGTTEQERTAVQWIRWLVREVTHFERASGVQASFGQMLLLIAIHFHSNQNNAIADLVCSTLGMKSAVKANALTRMKAIFVHEIFTEQVVSSHAVNVAVTENLNADITGYLPIHCIYQLLRSRTFSKYEVPIKNWIYRQICSSATPLHSLMTPLIESYVNSIIVPTAKTDRTNEPISEQEILAVFRHSMLTTGRGSEEPMEVEGERSSLTTQLLLLYYVLLYQDTLLLKTPVVSSRRVVTYSGRLLAQLPIKYLLQQAQRQQQLYASLFPALLRLLATHYPHLCLVEDCLDEERMTLPSTVVCQSSRSSCSVVSLQQALNRLTEQTSLAVVLLQQLSMLSPVQTLPYAETIVSCLPSLLPPSGGCSRVPRRVLQLVHDIWLKLHVLMPRKLRVMTVNALRPVNGGFSATAYTEDDLTLDPLTVLRCDDRVFRCAPLLEMTLRVLEGFLQASRSHLASHAQVTDS